MQEPPRPTLDAETIRRMAADVVRITLTLAEQNAVRDTLGSLLDEIRVIAPSDRAGVEPEPIVMVEEWPR
jgi:hypothetical protein